MVKMLEKIDFKETFYNILMKWEKETRYEKEQTVKI